MANTQMAIGLQPVRHLFGGSVRAADGYSIADQYATGLYQGDPVIVTGTSSTDGRRQIGIATAGATDPVVGVFAGCRYVNLTGDSYFSKYWPASQATKTQYVVYAYVWDDPFILYRVQSDATGISNTHATQNANLVAGTGSTLTGTSGWYATAAGTGGTNQLAVYGIDRNFIYPGGIKNTFGAYAMALCLLNTSFLASGRTGI